MALGDGSNWSETIPTNDTVANQIDDYNRELRLGVRSRLAHEHIWPSSQTATSQAGQHRFITFQLQATIPTIPVVSTATQVGVLWVTSGNALMYIASGLTGGGTVIVNTGGNLNVTVGSDDAITRGFELVYADANSLTVNTGVLYHGTTKISKTSNTTLTLATAGNWWDGAVDSYAGGAGWCYIGVKSDGSVKLLGANPPDKADTAGTTAGTKVYWYDGAAYWRVLGAVWVHTDDTITKKWYQSGNRVMFDVPVNITTTVSSDAWSSATSCAAGIPAVSTVGIFGLYYYETSVGTLLIRPNGGVWDTNYENGVAVTNDYGSGQRVCTTDSSRQIQYQNVLGGGGSPSLSIDVEGYYLNIR